MERIIFNCYLNWLQKKNGNLFSQIKKLTIFARVLVILLFATLLAIIIGFFFYKDYVIFLLGFEALLGLVVYLYANHFEIKYSYVGFNNYKEHCKEFVKELKRTGIPVNESFILELQNKYIEIVNSNKLKATKNRDILGKWVMALLVPSVLALFGAIVNPEIIVNDVLTSGLFALALFLGVFLIAFVVIELVNLCIVSKNGEYQQLIEDLQGVIALKLYLEKDTENCKEENDASICN